MNLRAIVLACLLCIVIGGCTPRTAADPDTSISSSDDGESSSGSLPEPEEAEPLPDIPDRSEDETTDSPEEPTEPEYPPPMLADKEKQLLSGDLALLAKFIGTTQGNAAALSKETILAACIAEIERTKDLNAYIFEENEEGGDWIPAVLIIDTAQKLFGIESFDATDDLSYNADKECFAGTATEIPPVEASDVMGAPDDCAAYIITLEGETYLYTVKILRQNSMPYLRFLNCEKVDATLLS